jgi:hypothetical protein
VHDEGDAEAQAAGEQEPKPVPEDGGEDHLFIETLAAMIRIGFHGMSLF